MSLLPSKPDLVSDAGPRVVGVDSEDADALMSALSSGTARRILAELHDEPAPPAELADRADTTLQNTQYHLSNLEEAGAVEVIGTAYSEKGREMDVYAPADQPLVIFAGQEQQASGLKAALSRLLGGVGALLLGSLAIQETFGDGIGPLVGFSGFGATGGGAGGADGGDAARDPGASGGSGGAATDTPVETTVSSGGGDGGGAAGGSATPTPEPDAGGTATATSEPGIYTTEKSTRTATEAATETAARATEAATPTPVAEATPTAAPTQTSTPVETVAAASDGGIDAVTSLPPGVLFFLGGLTVLLVGVAISTRM